MKTVYKYILPITNETVLQIPEGYEILTLKIQKGIPCIWVLVDTSNKLTNVTLLYYGTGHKIEEKNIKYIDSILICDDNLVFHLFESTK